MNKIEETFPSEETPELLAEPETHSEPPINKPTTKQTSVAKSAGIVSIAVMFSRVLGLVREMIFARYFGAGFLYDAYRRAFRIPNVLRDLVCRRCAFRRFCQSFYRLSNQQKRSRGVETSESGAECAGGCFEHCYNSRNFIFAAVYLI